MARPTKEGMDYFPHDTDARNDVAKMKPLRRKFGAEGYGIYFMLLEIIFRNKDYEINLSDCFQRIIRTEMYLNRTEISVSDAEIGVSDAEMLLNKDDTITNIADDLQISEEKLIAIIRRCLEVELFDRNLFLSEHKLTSHGVKKRTELLESKRSRNKKDYENRKKKEVSDAETDISDAETQDSSSESGVSVPQSKVKESKVKETTTIVLTAAEEEFISVVGDVDGYPLDRIRDQELFNTLSTDFPTLDIIAVAKDWRTYKLDKPLKSNSNPRSQLRQSCENCKKWNKCLKTREEGSKNGTRKGLKNFNEE